MLGDRFAQEGCRCLSISIRSVDHPPLIARRSSKRHIRKFIFLYEWHKILCQCRSRDEEEAVTSYGIVDDAVLYVVSSRKFHAPASLDRIKEEQLLSVLKGGGHLLDTAPSAIEFKDITWKTPTATSRGRSLMSG